MTTPEWSTAHPSLHDNTAVVHEIGGVWRAYKSGHSGMSLARMFGLRGNLLQAAIQRDIDAATQASTRGHLSHGADPLAPAAALKYLREVAS